MSDFDPKDIHKDVTSDFAPEDVHSVVNTATPENISKAESFLKGAQQGTTLGFGDEIQGGIEGALNWLQSKGIDLTPNGPGIMGGFKADSPAPTQVNAQLASQGATGDVGPQSTLDMYRQARDASRADFNAAQQANPMSSLVGNVAGGALTAMAAPQTLMNPLGSASKTAPLLQKMAQGAINAAPSGAAMGLGTSNADLTQGQVVPALADTAMGAVTAAGFGASVPLVGTTIGGVKNSVADSKVMQDLLDSYKAGMNKVDLSNPEFLTKSRDQLKALAAKADDAIRNSKDKLFGDKKTLLTNLENKGVIADTTDALNGLTDAQNASGLLKPDEDRAITNTMKKVISKGYLKGPLEIENTLQQLKALRGSTETDAGRQMVDDAVNKLKSIQNSMDPQIQEINGQLNHVIDASDAIMKRGPLDYSNAGQDLSNKEALANLLEQTGKYKTDSFMNDVLDKGLETSKNAKINPLNETVPEAAQALREAAPIVKNMNLAKGMQGETLKGTNAASAAANYIKGNVNKLANKAGQGVSENAEFLQKGVKYLTEATPEGLQELSSKMANTAGTAGKEYARVLQNAIGKNNVSKNAIMFGLMQQPEYRNLMHQIMDGESSNVEPGK